MLVFCFTVISKFKANQISSNLTLKWQQYAPDKEPIIESFEHTMTKLHSGQEMP